MKIEWASSFNPDGSRKKPAPSKMHGWLAKMRGTLLGDETLRSRGMREMKDATIYKRKEKERQRKARGGRSFFASFLATNKQTTRSSYSKSRSQSHRSQTLRRSSPPSRKPSSRPGPVSRRSSTRTHLSRGQSHQSRPTPRRRNTTR